jgi:hypothetical protein
LEQPAGRNPGPQVQRSSHCRKPNLEGAQNLGQVAPAAAEEPVPVTDEDAGTELPEIAPVSEQEASEMDQTEQVIPETTEPAPATTVTPQAPDVAADAPAATKKATRAKKAPVAATNAGAPREGSKTSQGIAMLKPEGGVTVEEIMSVMGWQTHTTRSLLSAGGSLTKNHGLVVISEKVGEKRTCSIKA